MTLAWIEPLAVITALLAVGLGVLGQRITWLFWVLSSALFGWIFAEAKLWADCGLQVMFFFAIQSKLASKAFLVRILHGPKSLYCQFQEKNAFLRVCVCV